MIFPYYKQLDAMDCGATCLRMVAKYYGKTYSAQTLRERSHITHEGVSLLGISDAAESIGIRTMGVKITFDKLVKGNPCPFIAHWRQAHFVVVYKIKRKNIFRKKRKNFVADPQTPLEYYNILNGYWKDGSPYTYGGTGYGGTTPVHYVFTGNPVYTTTWNEAYVGNSPGDRRGVGIVGPFTLDAGQEICIDVAFCNAIAYDGNNLLSVKYLLSRTGYLQWWKSNHPGISCDSIITLQQSDLHLFAQDSVYCPESSDITLSAVRTGGVYPFTYEWTDSSGTVFQPFRNLLYLYQHPLSVIL